MLLLASQSPRRRQLLAVSGWEFQVLPADVDELTRRGETPRAYVLRVAESKARQAAARAGRGWVVVGADTAVVSGEEILGKPRDRREAVETLRRLRGRNHRVYTGIVALRVDDGEAVREVCVTEVPMRLYSDDEINAYVATGDPLDKAGAYAIQHPGFRPVERLGGCFANVMGLPLCHLVRALRRLGISPADDVPRRCQEALAYDCPVFEPILRGEL